MYQQQLITLPMQPRKVPTNPACYQYHSHINRNSKNRERKKEVGFLQYKQSSIIQLRRRSLYGVPVQHTGSNWSSSHLGSPGIHATFSGLRRSEGEIGCDWKPVSSCRLGLKSKADDTLNEPPVSCWGVSQELSVGSRTGVMGSRFVARSWDVDWELTVFKGGCLVDSSWIPRSNGFSGLASFWPGIELSPTGLAIVDTMEKTTRKGNDESCIDSIIDR